MLQSHSFCHIHGVSQHTIHSVPLFALKTNKNGRKETKKKEVKLIEALHQTNSKKVMSSIPALGDVHMSSSVCWVLMRFSNVCGVLSRFSSLWWALSRFYCLCWVQISFSRVCWVLFTFSSFWNFTIGDSELSVCVYLSVDGCLSLCSPAMKWWLVLRKINGRMNELSRALELKLSFVVWMSEGPKQA